MSLGSAQGCRLLNPPCPRPNLTHGLPGQPEPNAHTILLQDSRVSLLQILEDGKWLFGRPIPWASVINIRDQHKSMWLRAAVNEDELRISVVSFLCPEDHSTISPPKALLEEGRSGDVYRDFTHAE